jgi:alkanesulfonate monooxygenase SsuD/methylene tetrahydromethanopterin reductase-like flavin-dependent oxidoreductase (luciferase family)
LLATALAMRTRTIRIGFSVLVVPLFEPIRLAEEIATLDVLSAGRVDFGVSRGNTSRYFEAWGLDYEDRSTAFEAGLETLLRYWTEPKVQVGSRTESIEPKCIQRPHPPVYVATYREESAAWIAEHGHTLFQGSQQSVPSIRRCIGAFRDAGGDVAHVPIGRFVVVGETDEAARRVALPAAENLTAGYRRGGEQVRRRISTEDELETERWLREVAIVGSPDTVAERIAALHEELGFGNFMLVTGFLGNVPQPDVVKTLELFAKEVMPRFQ